MSRFNHKEQRPIPHDSLLGLMGRIEGQKETVAQNQIIYCVIAHVCVNLEIPTEDIRDILDKPHEKLRDVTNRILVSTAIEDLMDENGAIHIVSINDREEPFMQAGIVRDDEFPDTKPHIVTLMLNDKAPDVTGWTHIDRKPTPVSLSSVIEAFATAGYLLVDELSKNSARVARRGDTQR